MPYFFSSNNLIPGEEAEVAGDEMRHLLLSHRAKKGEKVKLQGPDGKRFQAELVKAGKGSCYLKVLSPIPIPAEPKAETVLFQAVVAEKALDLVLQKATELGAAKVVLFNSKNVPAMLSVGKFSSKKERWGRVLKEAAKQSERGRFPELVLAEDFKILLGMLGSIERVFLLDADGASPGSYDVEKKRSFGLVVGPEGGLIPEEVLALRALPNVSVWAIGGFVLRADTAATGGMAVLRALVGA